MDNSSWRYPNENSCTYNEIIVFSVVDVKGITSLFSQQFNDCTSASTTIHTIDAQGGALIIVDCALIESRHYRSRVDMKVETILHYTMKDNGGLITDSQVMVPRYQCEPPIAVLSDKNVMESKVKTTSNGVMERNRRCQRVQKVAKGKRK